MRMSFFLSQASEFSERTYCVIIGPGSKYAFFLYSNEDHIEEIFTNGFLSPSGGERFASSAEYRPYTLLIR